MRPLTTACILALEAFVRGPGLNQCAVDAEVLIPDQLRPLGTAFDPLEEATSELFVEQTLVVGTEGRVIPYLVLEVQPHKPAIEQVVVTGFREQPLAANGEQDLQQQRLEQHLRRHRRTTTASIDRIELRTHAGQQAIDQRTQHAQRMLGRHPLFTTDVTEHRSLKVLRASHLFPLRRRVVSRRSRLRFRRLCHLRWYR